MTRANALNKIALAIVFAVGLSACQKQSEDTVSAEVRGPTGPNVNPVSQQTISSFQYNGRVFADPTYQTDFNNAIRDMMECRLPGNLVGYVDAQGKGGTGVIFGGKVMLASSTMRTNQGRAEISSTSALLLAVNDIPLDQSNSKPLPELYLPNATGFVQGNHAEIEFSDNTVAIKFVGTFDTNTFRGTVQSRVLNVAVGGGVGYTNNLGSFEVPTCGFFSCN